MLNLTRIEPRDEADQRRDRAAEVARAGIFHRVMADAAATAHEQHADRAELRHRLAVMARARAEPQGLGAERTHGFGESALQHRVTWRRRDLARRRDREGAMA